MSRQNHVSGNQELLQKIEKTIADHALFDEDNACLLMVSGGSDSTALAYVMNELRKRGEVGALAILHVNHMLRGRDADDDARFVKKLADTLEIPCFMCEIDIDLLAGETGGNIEAIARAERYKAANEALASMCQHEGFPLSEGRIVTAHSLDDRVENFYMRSIVGTGPGGFRSMLYENGNVVRPLLDVDREQLRDYIDGLFEQNAAQAVTDDAGMRWREDATNQHTDRFRAFVRHTIVPQTQEWNMNSKRTLARTMNLIADEDDMLDAMADEAINESVEPLEEEGYRGGFLLMPSFGAVKRPLARRCVHKLLKLMLGFDTRIDTASIEAILDAFDDDGKPRSGYVVNVQNDLAVSSNKKGVRVEPMAVFRARRKRK